MYIWQLTKPVSLLLLCGMAASFSSVSHALPFTIVPAAGTTLPTQIIPGQTISALYTITNNTGSQRAQNYIKYLPPNTSQVTSNSGISDLCGSRFTLQSNGSAGDSCTLELNITGPVNGSDPNPHHHLFACFPGGLTCAGTNNPLNVSAVSGPGQLVAVGEYNGATDNAGIAFSNSQGTSWNQQVLALPAGIVSSSLSGDSCSGSNCVAVGKYNNGTNDLPGIAQTTDGGNTWSQQVLTPPAGFITGRFSGVSCVGNTCIAAGYYYPSGYATEQFAIGKSTDGGATWSQQALSLTAGYLYGALNGIKCIGSICVAVGSYQNDSNVTQSAVVLSSDGGNTWSQSVLPLPGGIQDAYLSGVSCSGSLCIAVGGYYNGTDTLPGIAVSHNSGNSWSQTTLTPPGSNVEGTLSGISCTSTSHCVAVGFYSPPGGSDAPSYPAVAITTDGGNTWSQQALTLPGAYTYGFFYAIDCTGNTCVAAGYYSVGDTSNPGVAISTNGGQTWTQQVLPLLAGITNAGFLGIN